MRLFAISFLTFATQILLSCGGSPPRRLSYVVLDKPQSNLSSEGRIPSIESGKFRFGIFFIPASGVHSYLKEMETQTGSSVLRNVDVVMRPGFCILPLIPVVCVTRYSVVAGDEGKE
ncbi:hypothetical protein LFX25_15925 [Leptospira sp. FAT2]|uniref:LIC10260 family lipoprotein n=1 Tax=Leptospira sanjuanensis TaxID=2879643 RepID=UPI001EE8BF0B|nr:hypothetical protein [Leptospira sanjuanensis]MCG6169329.1 hypothetical protein [Leptospira sanjuanensis]MCG6194729.1 hypothetical protein [Leptospira sanjuanensis]